MTAPTPDPSVRVAEIEARERAATEGPWETLGPSIEQVAGDCKVIVGLGERGSAYMRYEVLEVEPPDAEFIAHAREDIPWLIERLHAAEAGRVQAEARAAKLKEFFDDQAARKIEARRERDEARAELATVKQQCSENLREIAARDAVIARVRAWVEREKFETGRDDPPFDEVWNVVGSDEIERTLSVAPASVLSGHDAEVAAKALEDVAAKLGVNQSITEGEVREGLHMYAAAYRKAAEQ